MAEEVKVTYNKMRQQISATAQKLAELDTERNEYDLVVKTLQPMAPERKCFRMIGGVLVERTVAEVLPAVAKTLSGIEQLIESLMSQLKTLETEANNYRAQHNLVFQREAEAGASAGPAKANAGILA